MATVKIDSIYVIGDIVEVRAQVDGISKVVRRHVDNYESLSKEDKKLLWYDILGVPQMDYSNTPLRTRIKLFFNKLRRKI